MDRAPRRTRKLFKKAVLDLLQTTENLDLAEGGVVGLEQIGKSEGIRLYLDDGRTMVSKSVVIASGTFLNGLIHIGQETQPAGRIGDAPAPALEWRPGAQRDPSWSSENRHTATAAAKFDPLGRSGTAGGR